MTYMSTESNRSPQSHFRVCNYCEAMCGIEVQFDPSKDADEDKFKVLPDKNDPFSKGSMCPKASALGALHYDVNRLKKPVQKVGDNWVEMCLR
jgi:anaerobic selenocysteine-containing dehydrogenase